MRKFKLIFVFLLAIFMFNGKAFAATAKLSVSTSEVTADDSFKVMVDMSSAAAWNIKVTASGPVKGCSINQSSASADGSNTSNVFIANCVATDEGKIELVLNGDIKSAEMSDAVEISDLVVVNVKAKTIELPEVPAEEDIQETPSTVTPQPSTTDKPTSNVPEEKKEEPKPVVKSDNNNVKDVIINGTSVQKGTDNIYSINVKKSVASATVEVIPEDDKASVEVRGVYNLNVGNNNFDATITSESGIKNVIKIKINRANIYEIDELETVLNDNNITNKEISIRDNMIFNEEILNIVKNSGKLVYFDYINSNKLSYRWILDGSKINPKNVFTAKLELSSDDKENLKEKLNADEIIKVISQDESETLEGIKLYVYVGNKFKNGEKLKVYEKDKYRDEYNIVLNEVVVDNGYITFDVNKKQTFYVVKEKVTVAPVVTTTKNTNNNMYLIIGVVSGFVLVVLGLLLVCFKKKKKGNDKNSKEMPSQPIVNVDTNSAKEMPMQQATTPEVNNVVQPVTTPEISNTQPAVTTDFNAINQTTQPVAAPSFNEINQNTQPVLNQNNIAAEFAQPITNNTNDLVFGTNDSNINTFTNVPTDNIQNANSFINNSQVNEIVNGPAPTGYVNNTSFVNNDQNNNINE